MSGRGRFHCVSIRRSISTVCPHHSVMHSGRRRTRCRSKTSRRTLGLRKGGYNQQDRGGQPESALHFHGCLPFLHNMRRLHHRTGCTILGATQRACPLAPGTKSIPWCLHLSAVSRPVKVIVPPEITITLLFPVGWMCYKRPSEGCPDMAQKYTVSLLPVDLAIKAGAPPQAESTAKAKPMANAYRAVQHSELPSAFCPRCSARLEPRSCKLICSSCGYYMSCSDFY